MHDRLTVKPHRILFLYPELAGYFLASVQELAKADTVGAVMVVHWPVNQEAPFEFRPNSDYDLREKPDSYEELAKHILDFDPTAIICSGWRDYFYLLAVRKWRNRVVTMVTFDNWWTGSTKQRIGVWTSPFWIKRLFHSAWVPGTPQSQFARKLGFTDNQILKGLYCANPAPFDSIWSRRKRLNKLDKKLLYIGRYRDFKGIEELWKAFISLSPEFPEWELHCIGTGDLWPRRAIHPNIIHHGFLQPEQMETCVFNSSAFIMPSYAEPWGVVLHEMAIAGLPILASDRVGSAERFLRKKKNGWITSLSDLKSGLHEVMNTPEDELFLMSIESRKIGASYAPKNWALSLLNTLSQDEE